MPTPETAVAVRVVSQIVLDLYNSGKDRFGTQLEKWKNTKARSNLVTKVAMARKVKAFWQRDKEVPLSSFYYPSKVTFDRGVTKNISSLRDFPSSGNFVIQGTIGQGKSIFLRYLCVQELKEAGSSRIPVFLELRTLTNEGLLKALFAAMDRLGFVVNDSLFEFYAESGKIVILLDAFDETDASLIKETIRDLEGLSEKYSQLQIIITSRPDSEIQNSRLFRVVHLAALTPNDHEPFFKRIGIKDDNARKLLHAIKSSSSEIMGLLTTPLMLTLLTIVYQAESSIPNELPDFFDSLFQTLFTKHDKSKPGLVRTQKSGLGERRLQQLFQGFCFSTLQLLSKTVLSNEEFHKILEQAFKHTDIQCDPEGFKHDVIKVVCLMQEDGYELHFIHKSVLEFYAASFVRNLHEDLAIKFYSQLSKQNSINAYKWQQVLQFLSQIDKYRYTKHFAIPDISKRLHELGIEPPYNKILNGEQVAAKAFSGVGVAFGPQDTGVYTIKYLGPLNQWSLFFHWLNDIPNILILPSNDDIHFSSREELLEKFPDATKPTYMNEELLLTIPWKTFATQKQYDKILNDIVSKINLTIDMLHSFEEFLVKEEQKLDLLDI